MAMTQAPKTTLFRQLFFSHFLIVLLSLSGIGGFTLFALRNNSQNNVNYYLTLEVRNLVSLSQSSQAELVKSLQNRGFWIEIYDRYGRPLHKTQAHRFPDRQWSLSSLRKDKLIRHFSFMQDNTVWYFVSAPIYTQNKNLNGLILLGLSSTQLNRDLGASFFTLISLGVIISVITFFLIWGFSGSIADPINEISQQARKIAFTGELNAELFSTRKDEIGQLAIYFNTMIERLRDEKNFQKDFIANVSHELKTPVTAISSASEILTGLAESAERKPFFEIIARQADRLAELIKDLLDISAFDSGKLQLNLAPVKLEDFVRDCVGDIDLMAEKAQIDFSWYIDPGDLRLEVDAPKLRRALVNLLTNAIKHTPPQGEVILSVQLQEGLPGEESLPELHFIVQDSGTGIAKDELEKIFIRFYRTEHDRSRETGGSGLGLSIVQQIIDLHQGKVEVKSELGKGARFKIMLPLQISQSGISPPTH